MFSPTVPPYPVGIIPPRTKSPMSPPESSTIASYVTLRKTKKPESRSVGCPAPPASTETKKKKIVEVKRSDWDPVNVAE